MSSKLGKVAQRAVDAVLSMNLPSSFGHSGFVLRSRSFAPDDLKIDLSGRVYLVTGANSGIGLATCRSLAQRGGTVYLLCRNPERGREALSELQAEFPEADLHLEIVDLSELSSIRAFCERFPSPRVDALVNNAGVLPDRYILTGDGHELTFATNLLGPFALIRSLESQLRAAQGRVINVASGGMYLKRLDSASLSDRPDSFSGVDAYANTKRALVVTTEQWAKTLAPAVSVNSMHPGWVDTPAVRDSLPRFHRWTKSFLRDANEGADTIVWLAAADSSARFSGKFFFDREARSPNLFPWTREKRGDREALWQLLWKLSDPDSAL